MQFLRFLQKNLAYTIPVFMLLGGFFGYFTDDVSFLKQLILPITFLMVYPMMVTLNVKSIASGKDTKLQVMTQLINFILMPVFVYGLGLFFFTGEEAKFGYWAVGLFLLGVLPASGMTVSWTGFAKGNKESAMKMLIYGLMIGSLATPVYTQFFMGKTVDIDALFMFKKIALFVFLPLFAGLSTQYLLLKKYSKEEWNTTIKPLFSPFSALGVNIIVFVAMALKAKTIVANPADLLTIFVPLFIFYLVTYIVISLIGKFFLNREDAIAMVYGVVMRDLSIALAIAMTAFGEGGADISLLIALAYIIQVKSAAFYVKFVDKIFGKPVMKESKK